MALTWTADTTLYTADSTFFLADGSVLQAPSAVPYLNRITSEHNLKQNFMAMIATLCGGIGDMTAEVLSMPTLFDLDVAVGNQLDIVGEWVGQPRIVADVLTVAFFGFQDDEAALTFGELTNPSVGGVFYELGATYESTTTLSDSDYRTIIRARIVRNQAQGQAVDIESALQYIFGVPCQIHDIGDWSLAIVVGAPITQTQEALLNTLDILPRPAGIQIGSITYSPL